jgi:ferric-dicitrate binding protein FerR (iron transport regulator)
MAATAIVGALQAQAPEPVLPRPGAVLVTEITGAAFAVVGDQRKPIKADDRLRVGSIVETQRKSLVTLMLSNGATVQLGDESELEIEEFGQAVIPMNTKIAELKEEPTISRTRLRLLRGDVAVDVKPLKVSRGSLFLLTMTAGTVRLADGSFRAMVRMSDLGLGVCTLELKRGAAEFELAAAGAAFAPVPPGRKLAFAVEVDKATGVVKVGEMPKETPPPKK